MSLCSEISLHSVPLWSRACSVYNLHDQDCVLLYPELLSSPLNKSLAIKTFDSSGVVSVGEYKVKASLSSTLQSIFDKYGDIASDSKLKSLSTRTYHLETLAEVVIELQSTPLHRLTESRAGEILAIVKDIETAKIRVSWLRSVLEEVVEATRFIKRRDTVAREKEPCEQGLVLAKQEMELSLKKLADKSFMIRNLNNIHKSFMISKCYNLAVLSHITAYIALETNMNETIEHSQ